MKKYKNRKYIILIMLLAIITGTLFIWNFYPQSGIVPEMYADTTDHATWAYHMITGSDYPVKVNSYPLFFLISGIFMKLLKSVQYGICLSAALIGILTFITQLYFFSKTKIKSVYLIIFISFGLTFVWPIILNPSYLIDSGSLFEIYKKSWSPTPAQNLTSLAVRPISLLAVSTFIDIFKTEKIKNKLVLLSILLLLSVLIKPSFYQYFAFAAAIYTICNFIANRNKKCFIKSLYIALALIPATIWVIYSLQFNLGEMIIYPFRSLFLSYGKDPWLCFISLARGQVFCIAIFIFLFIKKNISKEMWFIYLCIAIAFGEFVLLNEPAEELNFNFAWGYMNATYILFVYSVKELLNINTNNKIDIIIKFICSLLLLLHMCTGIISYVNYANNYRSEYKLILEYRNKS